jgi:hypothetical protein
METPLPQRGVIDRGHQPRQVMRLALCPNGSCGHQAPSPRLRGWILQAEEGPMLEFLNATIKEYEGCAPVKVRRAGDRASNIATLVAADEYGIVVSYHGPDQSKRFAHPWANVMSIELSTES